MYIYALQGVGMIKRRGLLRRLTHDVYLMYGQETEGSHVMRGVCLRHGACALRCASAPARFPGDAPGIGWTSPKQSDVADGRALVSATGGLV